MKVWSVVMDRIKKFEPLWGMWKCDAVLGEGSFGRVYRAVRKEGERVYYSAVKHISVPANEQQLNEVRSSGFYNSDAEISKYFGGIVEDVQREVDFMYTLKGNANIVSYEDHLIVPKEDGIGCDIFIRMELLRSLNSIIKSNLTVEDAIKIGSDICNALEVCAKSRIVHRDIKPSNIFVNANGDYKLGDFGIAKVLNSATVGMSKKGTYFYMAPEIYKCEPANFTSDIYSLGIVLYRILNDNCLPFMPTNGTILLEHQEAALVKTMTGQPMPPPRNATPQLAAVILKACSFNMRNRFQTPGEFKKALNDAYLGKYVEQVPAVSEDTVKVDEENTTPINAVFGANPAQAQQRESRADSTSTIPLIQPSYQQPAYQAPQPAPANAAQPLQQPIYRAPQTTPSTVTQPLPQQSNAAKTTQKAPTAEIKEKKEINGNDSISGVIIGMVCFLIFLVCLIASCGDGCQSVDETGSGMVYTDVDDVEPEIELDLPPEGEVLNIYVWNEEFKGFVEQYYTIPDGIEVRWIINTDQDNIYQTSLDEMLACNETLPEDERVDIFLAEPSYSAKYVDSEYTMDVASIGFENSDTMYDYAIDMCTDSEGVCKGIAPMICPGTLIYRRSIARDVLGTDSPDEVQAALGSWDKFEEVAALAKSKGYYMTASYQETFRAYTANRSRPWVDSNGNISVPPEFEEWAKMSKDMAKNKTTLKGGLWETQWSSQMASSGKTMCYFGPSWYYNFSMGWQAVEGDWAVCRGPQAYDYGGYSLLVATGTDNPRTIRDLFEAFTTDEDMLDEYSRDNLLMANNRNVMEVIAEDDLYSNYLLGGQNDYEIQVEVADQVKWRNATAYDFHLDTDFMYSMRSYINGSCSYEEAVDDFCRNACKIYPELSY